MSDSIFWILPFAMVLPIAGLQLVRERMVSRLQARRDPSAQHLSDWAFTPGLPGYATPIKRRYIWGRESHALLRDPQMKQLVIVARLLNAIFWIAFSATVVALYVELA